MPCVGMHGTINAAADVGVIGTFRHDQRRLS
jgi:hypothetical protein